MSAYAALVRAVNVSGTGKLPKAERLALGPRVIYISYGGGIANSKLKMSVLRQGTARNMNSVARIAGLLAGME